MNKKRLIIAIISLLLLTTITLLIKHKNDLTGLAISEKNSFETSLDTETVNERPGNPIGSQGNDGPTPKIIQVSPLGLTNAFEVAILPVTIYGENIPQTIALQVGSEDMTSRILSQTPTNITFYLTKEEAETQPTLQLLEQGGTNSNLFYTNHTTLKHPDILFLEETVINQGGTITIRGHNFFETNSKLYINNTYIPEELYTLNQNADGTFTLQTTAPPLIEGSYNVYFEVPTRWPATNYEPYRSNMAYFYLTETSDEQAVILQNEFLHVEFSGLTGTMKTITNKETGYRYSIKNQYPWRMRLRPLNETSLSFRDNWPERRHTFNPQKGSCIANIETNLQQIENQQKLAITWKNCSIEKNETFDYTQEYTLTGGEKSFEMSFYVENSNVRNYGLHIVKNYLTIEDTDQLTETGMQSRRGLEVITNPAYNTHSKGSRNICADYTERQAAGQPLCGIPAPGIGRTTPNRWITSDGDGFNLHPTSWLDLWVGYWNEEGEYLYAIPEDTYTIPKAYSYVGEAGRYKNAAEVLYPNSFYSSSFEYRPNFVYRIGIGKGNTYTGTETWINIADEFKEIQKEKGMLQTPFQERNYSEHPKYLDLTIVRGLGEFIQRLPNGTLINEPNPNSTRISDALIQTKKYYGAEEATLFIWGGEQDNTDNMRYKPIPNISFEFLKPLTEAGWNPCFYSHAGALHMSQKEPMFNSVVDQVIELDPAGEPLLKNDNTAHSYGAHALFSTHSNETGPGAQSYLQWLLETFETFNNNNSGMRCFYSDGIFVNLWHGNGGPWNQRFNQRGWEPTVFTDYKNFLKLSFEKLREIDPEFYTFHEAVSQFSTEEGLFPIHSAPGGILGESSAAATENKNSQSIQFYQRVWGGYIDFSFANELVDPNEVVATHVPNNFLETLLQTPGVDPNYNFTLEETYAIPAYVGVIQKGAIPIYQEIGLTAKRNYTSIVNITQAPQGSISHGWEVALEAYAKHTKEMVQTRQLARNYYHGLWHPGVSTNSPYEDYYYIQDLTKFLNSEEEGVVKASHQRVISTVRQPWNGTDWEDRYGIIFANMYQKEPNQTVQFLFDFERYKATVGRTYYLYAYTKEQGRILLGTYNQSFVHTLSIPAGKLMLLELESDIDEDKDGVMGIQDICPNTQKGTRVNKQNGCPIPTTQTFTEELTTNFSNTENLLEIENMKLGKEQKAKIEFLEKTTPLQFNNREQTFDPLNLSDIVTLEKNFLSVDAENHKLLDKPARITFYNITEITNPEPYRNGVYCTECTSKLYAEGTFVFETTMLSNYTVKQGTCGNNVCSITESCTTCQNDCGTCNGGGSGSGSGSGSGGGSGSGSGGANNNQGNTYTINLDYQPTFTLNITTKDTINILLESKQYTLEIYSIQGKEATYKINPGEILVSSKNLDKPYAFDITSDNKEDLYINTLKTTSSTTELEIGLPTEIRQKSFENQNETPQSIPSKETSLHRVLFLIILVLTILIAIITILISSHLLREDY